MSFTTLSEIAGITVLIIKKEFLFNIKDFKKSHLDNIMSQA